MNKLRVFVSSVQKELEHERASVAQLLAVDPFLLKHCDAVLFEKEPSTGRPDAKGYLDCLRSCQIYLLLVDIEYGRSSEDLSATHEEYRGAQEAKLPTLVFIRGLDNRRDGVREARTREFIEEVKRAGHKDARFHDREDLKPALRAGLGAVLKREFHLEPSNEEAEDGDRLIEVASPFEAAPMPGVTVQELQASALADLVEEVIEEPGMRIWDDAPEQALVTRGLATRRPGEPAIVSRAAYLLFAPRPAHRFPQCEILADAYDEPRITGRPKGQETVNAPILAAVEQALKFIDGHTFHPRRVVGLNNLRLDEYPVRALREALVNAVAHRSYDDAARKIILRVFSDRVELASPGYPPRPLTLARLRKGNYRPCSRNPLIAQTLALLHQMEQRGTGFARMRDAMLDHGLDSPVFGEQDGYFVVTFCGPNGNYDRLKVPTNAVGLVTPAIEAQLNDRQKQMVALLAAGEELTSRRCEAEFQVTRPVTAKDLGLLVKLGVAQKVMQQWVSHDRQQLLSEESRPRFEKARRCPGLLKDPKELRTALLDFIADFPDWNNSTVKEYLETSCLLSSSWRVVAAMSPCNVDPVTSEISPMNTGRGRSDNSGIAAGRTKGSSGGVPHGCCPQGPARHPDARDGDKRQLS